MMGGPAGRVAGGSFPRVADYFLVSVELFASIVKRLSPLHFFGQCVVLFFGHCA